MTRRCSHCSNNGHNSRKCPTRVGSSSVGGGLKLFGVRLTDGSIINKSASMGSLCSAAHYHSSSPKPDSPSSDQLHDPVHVPDGYLSDDPDHASSSANRRGDRKKGTPWREEEHRMFLIGLQNLGKGDWRGIARNYVTTRTPTQVASHAQKYFIRRSNATRRNRRSSLFDMVPNMAMDPPPVPEEQVFLPPCQEAESEAANSLPSLNLSLSSDCEPMETTHEGKVKDPGHEPVMGSNGFPPSVPGFFPAYLPYPFPIWPPSAESISGEASHQQVLRPTPILPKEPFNVDAAVDMSQLSLGETERGHKETSPLSLKLLEEPSGSQHFPRMLRPVSRT